MGAMLVGILTFFLPFLLPFVPAEYWQDLPQRMWQSFWLEDIYLLMPFPEFLGNFFAKLF